MQLLGHDAPPLAFWRENLITDAALERCPVRTLLLAAEATPALSQEVDRYVETYYPAYRDGFLLRPGGVAAQPARYLELVSLVRGTKLRVDEKAAEIARERESSGQPEG